MTLSKSYQPLDSFLTPPNFFFLSDNLISAERCYPARHHPHSGQLEPKTWERCAAAGFWSCWKHFLPQVNTFKLCSKYISKRLFYSCFSSVSVYRCATWILLYLTSLICGVIQCLFVFILAVRAATWHQPTTMETSCSRHMHQLPFATSGKCLASDLMTTWYSCLLSIYYSQKMCSN